MLCRSWLALDCADFADAVSSCALLALYLRSLPPVARDAVLPVASRPDADASAPCAVAALLVGAASLRRWDCLLIK